MIWQFLVCDVVYRNFQGLGPEWGLRRLLVLPQPLGPEGLELKNPQSNKSEIIANYGSLCFSMSEVRGAPSQVSKHPKSHPELGKHRCTSSLEGSLA